VKDKKEGFGCMQLPNGDQFVGHFRDDTFHNFGRLSFTNGDYFEGNFKAGKFFG
jgi:hypothetical protein